MTTREITNSDEVIDSRDVIERIEQLEILKDDALGDGGNGCWSDGDEAELAALIALADEASRHASDWTHGEALIHDDYFVEYTRELIADCYEMPKGADMGSWPYRHMRMDYAAAAEELKQDYSDVEFSGQRYWIRS